MQMIPRLHVNWSGLFCRYWQVNVYDVRRNSVFWILKKDDEIEKSKKIESRKLIKQLCSSLSNISCTDWQHEFDSPSQVPSSFTRNVISSRLNNGTKVTVVRYQYHHGAFDGAMLKYACYMDDVLIDSEKYMSGEAIPDVSLANFFEGIFSQQNTPQALNA